MRQHRAFQLFLFTLAPLISLLFLVLSQDPILGTERDFGVFWTASSLILQGDTARLYDAAAFREALLQIMGAGFPDLPFLYPPHATLFLTPLGLLPPLPSLIVWLVLGFVFIAFALQAALSPRNGFILALLISPASVVNIACGQNAYLSAGLLGGGLLLLRRHPVWAGLLFGLLSYKPQMGLVLPFLLLAGRHWLAFGSAAVTTLLLLLASRLVLGGEAWSLYLGETLGAQGALLQNFEFTSLAFYMAALRAGAPQWLAGVLQAGACVLAIGGAVWAARRDMPAGLQAAIVMTGTFLAAPYVLPYDMMIVAAAILLAAGSGTTWRGWEVAIFALAWILPALTFPPEMPIGPIIVLLAFLALLQQAVTTTQMTVAT